jgi:hypothetical protein
MYVAYKPNRMKAITTFSLVLFIAGFAYAKPFPTNNFSKSTSAVVQTTSVFGTFHAHREGDFASLNWNVNADGISAFAIERSYDGEFFDMIDAVTPDPTRWNRYTDATVEPGIIYYRVVAWMDDGTIEYSTTEVVKIVKHK